MKQIQGGVTAAKGFEAAGVEAAIKYQNRKDMALIVSKAPCTVAGTFTSNVVKAAPVLWDKQIVEHSAFAQAVVVNSGIANACTGRQGLDCCEAEAKCAGELLGVPTDAVLVASTGVIGMQIPVDKITAGIKKLVTAKAGASDAESGQGIQQRESVKTRMGHGLPRRCTHRGCTYPKTAGEDRIEPQRTQIRPYQVGSRVLL